MHLLKKFLTSEDGVGLDVANMVTVPVGPSGTVCLYANRTTHLVVDVAGWYGTA